MRIVSWSRNERRIAGEEASDFFDRPLTEPWLFHFTTSHLRVDRHAGAFSLKLILAGEEGYGFGRRSVRLRPGRLLFAAAGREYDSDIGSPSESLSIFLPDAQAAAYWTECRGDHDRLIDASPDEAPASPPAVAWRGGVAVARQTERLRRALAEGDDAAEVAFDLLLAAGRTWHRPAPLRSLGGPGGAAVREELLQRVMRARDLILDRGGIGCRLDLLADAACLSRFHFLRAFSEAFGRTPGEVARAVRIERAAAVLETGRGAAEAAKLAGYSRASSLRRAQSRSAAC